MVYWLDLRVFKYRFPSELSSLVVFLSRMLFQLHWVGPSSDQYHRPAPRNKYQTRMTLLSPSFDQRLLVSSNRKQSAKIYTLVSARLRKEFSLNYANLNHRILVLYSENQHIVTTIAALWIKLLRLRLNPSESGSSFCHKFYTFKHFAQNTYDIELR